MGSEPVPVVDMPPGGDPPASGAPDGATVVPEGGAFQLHGWENPLSAADFDEQYVRVADYTAKHQGTVQAFEDEKLAWHAKRASVEQRLVDYARDIERRGGAPGTTPGTPAGPATPPAAADQRLLASVAKTVEAAGGTLDADSLAMIESAIGAEFVARDQHLQTLQTQIATLTGQVNTLHGSYQGLAEHNQTASMEEVIAAQKALHPEVPGIMIDMAVRSYDYENFEQQFPGVVANLSGDYKTHATGYAASQKEPSIADSGIPGYSMPSPTPSSTLGDAVDDMDSDSIAEHVMREFPEAFQGE